MAQLTIHPDYATDADWAEASRRAHALNPLRGKRRCTGVELAEAAETLGLSIPRAYELLRAYRKSGDTSALLPQHPGTKSGTTRLDPECEAIISRCIHESILTRTKVSLRRLLLDIEAACSAANVPRPSLGAVRARVKKLDRKVVTVAQHGQKAADDQFRPVRGQFDAEQALEKTQIDHTPVDMIIVDDVMRLPLGRPWISLSIDIASRDIPSFYVSLAHPSRTSVAMTMALMATDIGQIFALPEHMLASSCQGIPDLVHFDNAKEFHANSMQYGCAKHGIEMQYRRIATPHYGGHIERLIGTQMGEVHFLPGTTFSNVQERGDYDSEKHSAMTMTEFTQWFALQVIKYRNMIHSSLDRPPAAVWEELVRTRPTLIRQATDPYRYMIDFLPYKLRSIRRDGIRLFNIFYWSDVLAAWAGQCRHKLMVHYDPRNLSQVYLETPDGEIWPIPYKDPRRPPISHWEHSRACQALRVQGREEYDEELIFDTIARQREIIADSISKTKQARRTAQRIMNDLSFDASILRRSMALPGPIATPSLPAPAPAGLPLRGFDIDDD